MINSNTVKNDLKKSGILAETITLACIKEISPEQFQQESGYKIPCDSVYQIPYKDCQGNTILKRWRIFPGVKNNGKTTKYLHPKGKPAIPYISMSAWAVKSKVSIPLWLTEGEKKALKLAQHGEPAIAFSGVWNFKASDKRNEEDQDLWSVLKDFGWKGRIVYLAFDADLWTNPQVRMALYELSLRLYAKGAILKIVTWSAGQGKGIDDFLVFKEDKGQKAEEVIKNLKQKAKNLEDFVNIDHENAILRALALVELDQIKFSRLIKIVAKKLQVEKKILVEEILKHREKPKTIDIIDEERKQALNLLKDPDLMNKFLDACHTKYLGRDEELILVKLACVSRKFDQGLNVILTGTSSVGKSELIKTVLKTTWQGDCEDFTRISENYLLYRKAPLDHKIITFYELKGTESSAYIMRTAISEGNLKLGTVINDPKSGLKPAEINKTTNGMVILSTFASGGIDYELSTRVILLEISHDESLAREVYHLEAQEGSRDENLFKIWQAADYLIEPLEVDIPFSKELAGSFPTSEERFMRDFKKVLKLIKASALIHQYQRKKDATGRVIADQRDYELVYRMRHLISQAVSPITDQLMDFLNVARQLSIEKIPTREQIKNKLKKSDRTIRLKFASPMLGAVNYGKHKR